MGKGTTLFAQLQGQLPWAAFDRAVAAVQGDRKVHVATCRSHFLVLLLAMLGRQHSLRRIERGLAGRQSYLSRFGIGSVDRSTVSHANRHRPAAAAEAMYGDLLRRVQAVAPGHPFRFRRKLTTMDATELQVSHVLFEWARCAPDESGIKLHVFLDHNGLVPSLVEFGTFKTSELKLARRRTYTRGSVLCFDQGYFDTAWFRQLTEQGVTFVTRLPPRPVYTVLQERPLPADSNVLADQVIRFTSDTCRHQYPGRLRLVTFCDGATGNLLWFLTNQMTWSALTIAAVYKARWEIELFFKWLKQHLRLTHLLGREAEAVRWQVLVALCLYLLLARIKFQTNLTGSLGELFHVFSAYLFDPVTPKILWANDYQFQT
jgi:hypothetical protein